MNEKIEKAIGSTKVELSIISIIIGSQRISNEGLEFLCKQKLSHVTILHLGKKIDIKAWTK
jgi:hypothetical protein